MHARLGAWRDLLSRKLLPLDVRPLHDAPFQVKVQLRALPGLRFAWGSVDASDNPYPRKAAAASDDDFVLLVNRDDTFVAAQGGREATLGVGDASLMACSDAGRYSQPKYGRVLCVRIPRAALRPLVPNLDDRTARAISSGTAALRLLASYCRILDDNESLSTPQLRELTVKHIYDLTALVLNPSRDNIAITETGGVRAARLHAVKSFVLDNLTSNDLTVGKVADHLRVTPRYVQRLFESEGLTYSEFALISRLERAYDALTDERARGRNISDIAFDCGFSDVSHFNRTFRRRFNASPSDIRNRRNSPARSN
jgi:AraC-like DNA-binding protein